MYLFVRIVLHFLMGLGRSVEIAERHSARVVVLLSGACLLVVL